MSRKTKRSLEDAIATVPCRLERIDLVNGIRSELTQPTRAEMMRRPWKLSLAIGGFIAAAALALWPHHKQRSPDGVSIKANSRATGSSATNRWNGIQIYQVTPDGDSSLVQRQIRQGNGLLFSYTNLGAFDYLMVAGRSSNGDVYWYFPNPDVASSIPVRRGVVERELPELIHHDLPVGSLQIWGIYSKSPVTIEEAQRALRADEADPSWALQIHKLEVIP